VNADRTLRLGREQTMPTVGFGTYLIRNEDAQSAVETALASGYCHVDTAEIYRNEPGVGAAVRAFVGGEGTRERVFVTTKLWPGNPSGRKLPKTYAATLESLDMSLKRLGLEYVDLYLIHAPLTPEHRLEQWRALVELRRLGRAKAIGVSNYGIAHLEEIHAAGLPMPDANQIELHPWSQKPKLVSYLAERRITTIAYSSLVPLSTWRSADGQRSAKTDEMRAEGEREDAPFRLLAKKHGVTEAQVLLRWAVQRGFAVLPKSARPERIRKNIDVFTFELDESDMSAIAEMDRGDGVAWGRGDPVNAP